jgi:hypothetical protein
MSDVPSDAQARLLLEELKQRNRKLTRRGRLLATVRDGPHPAIPCSWFPVVVTGFMLLCMVGVLPLGFTEIRLLLLLMLVWVLNVDIETRKFRKQLNALVDLLEQEGLLQDRPADAGQRGQ